MPVIGHIAANHSTWDLELEDLSIENLILIYADFRVKSIRTASGAEQVCFYSLKDSFDVILSKLDNVDEKKKNRYRLVYARLKDFEEYMVHLGVNIDFRSEEPSCTQHEDYVLMTTIFTLWNGLPVKCPCAIFWKSPEGRKTGEICARI